MDTTPLEHRLSAFRSMGRVCSVHLAGWRRSSKQSDRVDGDPLSAGDRSGDNRRCASDALLLASSSSEEFMYQRPLNGRLAGETAR